MGNRRYAFVFIIMIVVITSIFLAYINREREGKKAGAEDVYVDDYDPTVNIELVIRLDRIRKLDFVYGEEPIYVMAITVDGYTIEDIGPWAGANAYPRLRHLVDVDDKKEMV